MPELSYLTIEHAPNKTTYFVGDRFERYGMIVKAHYDDGTSNTIDFYFINPSTSLSINDTQVTISFMDKSVTQSITVINPPSTGYFINKCLDKANYGNNPYVNTVDGSISFYNNPITVERDSYQLNVVLSYHSRMSDKESDLIKGFYKGFRTNYHQFLTKDGKDSDNNDIYKYIDGNGYIHTFVKIENSDLYHDLEGRYLLLDVTDKTITDSKNNVLTFDNDGRLTSIQSGLNNQDIKVIEYNNDGIRKIYDNRNPNVYIKFSYNFSFLVYIRVYYNDDDNPLKTYTFNGMFGQTTSITETAGNNTKTLYEYLYNDREKVRRIVDHLNHVAYRLTYDFDTTLNDYRFNSIRQGYMSNDSLIEQKGLYFVRRNINTSDPYKPIYELVIQDNNNIKTSFMSDSDGQLISTFELDEDNENNYLSFIKDEGKYAGIDGECVDSINSVQAILVSDILRFNQGLSSTDLDSSQYIKLCGYIKIKREAQRIILYTYGSNFNSDNIDINPHALNIWQYFEVKIERVMNNNNPMPLSSFSVELIDNENYFVEAEFANLYFAKSEAKQRLFFLNNDNPIEFNEIDSFRLYTSLNNYTLISNSDNFFYMNENDLLMTMKEYYKNSSSSDKKAYFLNGKYIKSFYALLMGEGSNATVSFFDSRYVNNDILGNYTNWFFAASLDAKTKTYYRFKSDSYEIIVRNEITDNSNQTRFINDISKYNYQDQLSENRKTYFDESFNESITVTTYEYFNDGQIKKIQQSNGTETIVLYEAILDNNNRIIRKTSGLQSIDISYEKYLESVITKNIVNGTSITNSLYTKQISYDNYLQDISSIAFKYNNESRGTNSVSQNGLTSTLSVNNNPLYQLTYNETNNTSTFKRYNGTSYDNVVSIKETSLINEITYFGNSSNTIVTNNYDEYGRLISQKLNNEIKVTFNFQSNWESPSVANLTSVNDKYLSNNGLTTTYSYDGYDYDRAITFNEYFEIKYLKNGDMEYDFDTEAYVYSSSNGYLEIQCNNSRSEYLSVKYTYDAFNRLSKKERVANSNLSAVLLADIYNFLPNTNLPSSYIQKDIANHSHVYETYSYDNHGNLSIVSTSFNGIIGNHTYPFTSYKQYTYDGFNRIVSESNSLLNDLSRTYSYDNQGRMSSFGGNQLSYNDKGQLESFGNIDFTYDNYGNRLTKDNDVYEWERGNLLKKIIKDGRTISYKYDYLGRRYQKDTYKETVIYFYEGNKLIGEDHVGKEYIDENNEEQTYGSFKLRFFYNNDNSLNGVRLIREIGNQTVTDDYIYIINPFGEIVGLAYEDGATNSTKATLYAAYIYDAWGNHKVLNALGNESETDTFIGYLNPFRYKGYYYDQETNLYYLMSRYYDSSVGQFISPDGFNYLSITSLSGYQLYTYCNNNPVMYTDATGHLAISAALFLGLVGASFAIGFTASVVSQGVNYGWENINGWTFLQAGIDGLFAACSMALAYTGIGFVASMAVGGVMGFAQYSIDSAFHNDFAWSGALIATGLGVLGGAISGRGAQHYMSIGRNLDDVGRNATKALLTAFDRYGDGAAYDATINLWSSRLATSLAKSYTQTFVATFAKMAVYTPISYGLSYFGSWGVGQLGWSW